MTTNPKQHMPTQTAVADVPNTVSVTDALTGILTDTYRLVLKTHTYHWNVTGPMFYSIHEMTEEQYTDMFAAADVLAERIRALGKPALMTAADLAAAQDGQDPDASLDAVEMVKDLLSDHESLARRLRALFEIAEGAGDPVTADLAVERAQFHEKAAWMLRATAA